MWPYRMKMTKKRGVLDFKGRANSSRFVEKITNSDIIVNLRIGLYVCAEWWITNMVQ